MTALKRMLPFVHPYRWVAVFLVITTVLPVGMELLVPRALRYVIDTGIEPGDTAAIVRGSAFMLLFALIGAIATLGQGFARAELSQGLAYDMRSQLFAHVQTFSFANLDQMQTGQILTRLTSDVNLVRMFVSAGLALLLRALLMVFGSVIAMLFIDWQLTLIMAVLLPLAFLLIWGVMRLARPLFIVVQHKLSSLNTIVQENLAGVSVVKAFVREDHENGRFRGFNHDYMDQNIRVGRLMALTLPMLTLLTNLGIVAVIWFGGLSVISGRLSIGELVAFNSYLMISMAPLMLLGNVLTMVSRADASATRVWEVLDTEPVVKTAVSPHHAAQLAGAVQFTDVTFAYTSSQNGEKDSAKNRDVLNSISFDVPPGQKVALLGATGSGKSTLISLIPRFYDSDQGHVAIDGINVREWDPDALRKRIGVVLQQTTLFSGTVHENIAYGRPDATQDEVIAAAKAAQAHDFISRLENGYDSYIEERGANLSGGQKQRIALARALLIEPSILIMDDSTSAVDLETEAKIKQALDNLMAGKTTFVVAQRIQSVLNADQIIVLDQGRIQAQGTHEELLTSSPIYSEIYQSQMGNGN